MKKLLIAVLAPALFAANMLADCHKCHRASCAGDFCAEKCINTVEACPRICCEKTVPVQVAPCYEKHTVCVAKCPFPSYEVKRENGGETAVYTTGGRVEAVAATTRAHNVRNGKRWNRSGRNQTVVVPAANVDADIE